MLPFWIKRKGANSGARLGFFVVPLIGTLLLLFACRLTQPVQEQDTLTFRAWYDSLAQFDSVVITVKDTSGHTIDNVYKGKVDSIGEIENLPAPHWDGGKCIISIIGIKGGRIVYDVQTRFDGATNTSSEKKLLISPHTSLSAANLNLQFTEDDSAPFPSIIVSPDSLADKTVMFISSNPKILSVEGGHLRAVAFGEAVLTALLVSDTSKSLAFDVSIKVNPRRPDSLRISPETLSLAAQGESGVFHISFYPSTADVGIEFKLSDSGIASISGGGTVQGLKKGKCWVWALT